MSALTANGFPCTWRYIILFIKAPNRVFRGFTFPLLKINFPSTFDVLFGLSWLEEYSVSHCYDKICVVLQDLTDIHSIDLVLASTNRHQPLVHCAFGYGNYEEAESREKCQVASKSIFSVWGLLISTFGTI
mgnify:CR=1 FL=1